MTFSCDKYDNIRRKAYCIWSVLDDSLWRKRKQNETRPTTSVYTVYCLQD